MCYLNGKMTKNKFFIRVLDETLNLGPTYPPVQWGTQSHIVLSRKELCVVDFSELCLGSILAVKRCLYACA